MNLSDCAADHALGQALGSVKHLPHGLTVGLVLAETLDVSRGDCADRLERVADALGEPADGSATGRAPCAPCGACCATSASRRCARSGSRRTRCPRWSRARSPSSRSSSTSTATRGRDEVEQAFRAALAARVALSYGFVEMKTLFSSVLCTRPSIPSSLPTPDSL